MIVNFRMKFWGDTHFNLTDLIISIIRILPRKMTTNLLYITVLRRCKKTAYSNEHIISVKQNIARVYALDISHAYVEEIYNDLLKKIARSEANLIMSIARWQEDYVEIGDAIEIRQGHAAIVFTMRTAGYMKLPLLLAKNIQRKNNISVIVNAKSRWLSSPFRRDFDRHFQHAASIIFIRTPSSLARRQIVKAFKNGHLIVIALDGGFAEKSTENGLPFLDRTLTLPLQLMRIAEKIQADIYTCISDFESNSNEQKIVYLFKKINYKNLSDIASHLKCFSVEATSSIMKNPSSWVSWKFFR